MAVCGALLPGARGEWIDCAPGESATPRDIRVDPQSLTTTYTIEFVTTSGRTTTEQGRLQLARQGDSLLIAGEG